MYKKPIVEIISWNPHGQKVCASAARISTTEGTALELLKSAWESSKNTSLIEKVLQSGHKSVIEHMTFSIAMENISVYAEQYFIEMRLASFTVKSRRYVDFGHSGYYIPDDLNGADRQDYQKHMDRLFEGYRRLLELGIPKEDARFILPYSFHSNLYCTINARELLALIQSIRCGRGSSSPELLEIAEQLANQVIEIFPAIAHEIPAAPMGSPLPANDFMTLPQNDLTWIQQDEIGDVTLTSEPKDAIGQLDMAYSMSCAYPRGDNHCDIVKKIMSSQRPRELEQLNYGFVIHNITLAGLTHLTRHRIQSLIVPPIESVHLGSFIIPETIANNSEALAVYKATLETSFESAKNLYQRESMLPYKGYFAVAGNVMDVMTTMNARELKLFIQLRTCNRAQWEIRQIATQMLLLLRQSCPTLFNLYGPSCFLTGVCPEGKMCCGKTKEMQERFATNLH